MARPFGTPARELILAGLLVVGVLQHRHQALHDGGIAAFQRVEALRSAGYTQFTVQIVPGQENAIEDWARIKRAFG